jgi:hypothetical protein
VVTRWFQQEFSLCGEGADQTTVSVVKEGGDGCTGWAIVAANTLLHLKNFALENDSGVQSVFVFENGTLICEGVVFKASESLHICANQAGSKIALLGCTFEPGASITLGDGSVELYMEDCIDKANLTVNGAPTRTGEAAVSIEAEFQAFCEEYQLPGAQCAIVIDGELKFSLAHNCSEADRVGLHCVFKIIASTCIAMLVEDG